MTDQEKLVDLINHVCEHHIENLLQPGGAEALADHLIANGVTAKRWIPVAERLPDIKKAGELIQITQTVQATDGKESYFGHFKVYKGDGSWMFVCVNEDVDLCVTDEITHWQPLPEPPKED
jgi:hypothetical protein